jgi:hypothetical protein
LVLVHHRRPARFRNHLLLHRQEGLWYCVKKGEEAGRI